MNIKELQSQIQNLGPVLVGSFVTGKVASGSRINAEKQGIKEDFAMLDCAVLSNRKVYAVKIGLKDDAMRAAITSKGNADKEDLLMPAKPGDLVIVRISSVKNEKGAQSISGTIEPLAR